MVRLASMTAIAALTLLAGDGTALANSTCFALESQLMQLQAGGLDRQEAARLGTLRARLARSGCGAAGRSARTVNLRPEPRQLGISRQTAPRSHALRRPAERAPHSAPHPLSSGTYRTICVRTCDGYYFPVSFSTTRDRFSGDAEICARMCPASTVGLYYHSVSDELPAEMVSLDGAPYSELANAFRYRSTFDAGCSCGRPAAEETTADGIRQQAADEQAAPIALPRPRPAVAQDPETIANRLGGFTVTEVEPAAFASAHGRFGKPVRIVGPSTAASQESELLLRPVAQ